MAEGSVQERYGAEPEVDFRGMIGGGWWPLQGEGERVSEGEKR